jgi:hypothetical protein
MPAAYYDPAELAPLIAAGEPVLFSSYTDFEGIRGATAVVTPTRFLVNGSIQPKDIDRTELVLSMHLSEIAAMSLEKADIFDRLLGRVSPECLVIGLRDGRRRRFYFHEKGVPVGMRGAASAMKDALGRALTNDPQERSS